MNIINQGLLAVVFSTAALGIYLDWQQQLYATKSAEPRSMIGAREKQASCHGLNAAVFYGRSPLAQDGELLTKAVVMGATLCNPPIRAR